MTELNLSPSHAPLRLEDMADLFGGGHFNRVAKRYSGEKGINGRVAAREALSQTFAHSGRLNDLVAKLHPTELQLLGELRRRGGAMDGWALYTFARLRGLKAPPVKFTSSAPNLFGGYQGAEFPGADLIWSLFADGLLVPASAPNHWLRDSYAYSRHRPFPDLPVTWVLADPRLLAHLPPVEAAPLTVPLGGVQPTKVQHTTPSAARLALHLQEVLRGLRVLGGLSLTQAGTYNKAGLGRLNKLLPALEKPEFWLVAAQWLGLLRLDVAGKQVQVCPEQERTLAQASPQQLVSRLAALVGVLDMPEDQAHCLPYAGALRSCLLALLRDLPGPATEAVVQRLLGTVAPLNLRLQLRDYRTAPNPQAWTDWLGATLRGTMSDFGLVSLENRDGQIVVTSGEVLGASPATPQSGAPLAGANQTPVAVPPAWILQPNFELLVYPAHLQRQHFAILYAAEAVRFDAQTATYRLTRDSVYAALEGGLSQTDLLAGLQSGSATPLAPSVKSTIQDWAARRERLTVHQGVTLLEYPTRSKRDAALGSGGTAVGETLLMLAPGQKVGPGISILKYDQAPPKPLKFSDDGTLTITGELDFLTRQLLEGRIAAAGQEKYTIRPTSAGGLPSSFLNDLEVRSSGRLPGLLRLQLGVWSGQTPPPRVAAVTLIQHPQAQALAQFPALKGLIGGTIGPNLFAVQPGKEKALETALDALGLTPHREILAPQGAASDLLMITDTRKKREFLEEAMRNGHNLLIQFNEEKTVGGWYSSRFAPGKRRLDEFQPLRVDRTGSTPYLEARNLKSEEQERIRVQYILGMAIR